MPYIKAEDRPAIDEGLLLALGAIDDPGKLNYAISTLVWLYTQSQEKINYTLLNEVMGAMESAKIGFYRRVVVPYEEKKIKENGDVYLT